MIEEKEWRIALSPELTLIPPIKGERLAETNKAETVVIRAARCNESYGSLIFSLADGTIKIIFSPGQWLIAELREPPNNETN